MFPAGTRGDFPQWERKSSRPPRTLSHANHPLHLLHGPAPDAGACFPARFIERVRAHFTLDNFARIIDLYDNDLQAIRRDISGCGFSDEEIAKILYANWMRIFEELL